MIDYRSEIRKTKPSFSFSLSLLSFFFFLCSPLDPLPYFPLGRFLKLSLNVNVDRTN